MWQALNALPNVLNHTFSVCAERGEGNSHTDEPLSASYAMLIHLISSRSLPKIHQNIITSPRLFSISFLASVKMPLKCSTTQYTYTPFESHSLPSNSSSRSIMCRLRHHLVTFIRRVAMIPLDLLLRGSCALGIARGWRIWRR